MDYLEVEQQIKDRYRQVTAQYRRDDEIEVTTENHRRLEQTLRQLCRSFGRPIAVLDVGCGTGRYFHCLENTAHLTGIDISDDMLAAARKPVREEEVTVHQIQLLRQNAYLTSFPADSFDLIYSLGMFGHGCPVTLELCNRFHEWLKPGGKLFFNVVDVAGLPRCQRLRRRVKLTMYPWLPRALQQKLDQRQNRSPFFAVTRKELKTVLASTHFKDFTTTSHPCRSPLWSGRHLECIALKNATQ